jgi:hypothetical protein
MGKVTEWLFERRLGDGGRGRGADKQGVLHNKVFTPAKRRGNTVLQHQN